MASLHVRLSLFANGSVNMNRKDRQTMDVDSFNPESSYSGFVNDAAEAPTNLLKFLEANKKKKELLKKLNEGG